MTYLQRLPHLLPQWLPRLSLQTLRQRRAQRKLDQDQAAHEACASEGAEVALGTVELDGQRFGALYRNGELVCLLPRVQGN